MKTESVPLTGAGVPCSFLAKGKCEKVKCHFIHKLPQSEISITLDRSPPT